MSISQNCHVWPVHLVREWKKGDIHQFYNLQSITLIKSGRRVCGEHIWKEKLFSKHPE